MNRLFRWAGCIVVVGLACSVEAPASAASCSINPQGVSFGSYDSLSAVPLDGVGNIHVSCDEAVSFGVSLGAGGGSYDERLMTGGATQLRYNLFTDASRTAVWGDGVSGNSVSATGENVNLAVYGRIPARQNVPANAYSDTITVTISY